jgi:Putative cell wall-binding domain
MIRRNKKIIAVLLGVLLGTAANSICSTSVSASSNRLWGQDRYETAVSISKQGWTSSDYVVIASGEGYADALCAAPLAKKYNAPILLTESNNLSSKTKDEIKRLNAKHIFIIGKYASISETAEKELNSLVSDVKRIGGNDRYETSVLVAKELGTVSGVAVTSGYGFADALSIAPIAAQKNMPILLTGKDELPAVVQNYIKQNNTSIKNSYIIGGVGVIGNSAAQQVAESPVRLSGQNRFETNLNVMKYFINDLKFDNLYIVQADGPTGKEFADALSGTALAVKTSSPVILTYKTVQDGAKDFIKSNIKSNSIITALGGAAAVPESIVTTLESYINTNGSTTIPSTGGSGGSGGSTGTTKESDGDIEFIFSNNVKSKFNYNNEKSVDISTNFKNNNLVKIRIYSLNAKDLDLLINGMGKTKHIDAGWTEVSVPSDFGIPDTGAPGLSQNTFDMIASNGQFNLTINSGSDSKTITIKYK